MIVLTGAALTLGGCAGSSSSSTPSASPAAPSSGARSAEAEPPLATTATVRKVVGHLSADRRRAVKGAIKDAVDRYFDAAFLGTYPRSDFGDAFSIFTKGAAVRAEKDLDLLTNAGLGDDVDDVTARNRRLRLDVLAVKGRPVGVTARFALGLDVASTSDGDRKDRITGSLFLTHRVAGHGRPGGWQVFAYDVNRGAVA